MQTLAPFLLQSSSLPVGGSLSGEEANHTESSTNTDTQADTLVGKWTATDPTSTVSSVC